MQLELEGLRITWPYVARAMAKSKRNSRELQLRLASLRRTYGKKASCSPRCFFTGLAPPSIFRVSRRPGSPCRRKGSRKGQDVHGGAELHGVFIRGGDEGGGTNEDEHGIDVCGRKRHAGASGPDEISHVLDGSLGIAGTDDQDRHGGLEDDVGQDLAIQADLVSEEHAYTERVDHETRRPIVIVEEQERYMHALATQALMEIFGDAYAADIRQQSGRT